MRGQQLVQYLCDPSSPLKESDSVSPRSKEPQESCPDSDKHRACEIRNLTPRKHSRERPQKCLQRKHPGEHQRGFPLECPRTFHVFSPSRTPHETSSTQATTKVSTQAFRFHMFCFHTSCFCPLTLQDIYICVTLYYVCTSQARWL